MAVCKDTFLPSTRPPALPQRRGGAAAALTARSGCTASTRAARRLGARARHQRARDRPARQRDARRAGALASSRCSGTARCARSTSAPGCAARSRPRSRTALLRSKGGAGAQLQELQLGGGGAAPQGGRSPGKPAAAAASSRPNPLLRRLMAAAAERAPRLRLLGLGHNALGAAPPGLVDASVLGLAALLSNARQLKSSTCRAMVRRRRASSSSLRAPRSQPRLERQFARRRGRRAPRCRCVARCGGGGRRCRLKSLSLAAASASAAAARCVAVRGGGARSRRSRSGQRLRRRRGRGIRRRARCRRHRRALNLGANGIGEGARRARRRAARQPHASRSQCRGTPSATRARCRSPASSLPRWRRSTSRAAASPTAAPSPSRFLGATPSSAASTSATTC